MTPLPEMEALSERLGATTEWIELVPYGCTHLRMTVFPDGYAALKKLATSLDCKG